MNSHQINYEWPRHCAKRCHDWGNCYPSTPEGRWKYLYKEMLMVNSLWSSLLASTHWTHMMNQPTLLATLEMMLSPTTRLSWELTNKMDSISGAVASTMHTQWTHRRPKRSVTRVKWFYLNVDGVLSHRPIRNCPMNTEGSSVSESILKFVKIFPARFSAFKDPAI